MKRLIPAVICMLLLAGCAVSPAPAPAPAPAPGARFPGRLAYARDGQVYVLDGATGRETALGGGHSPAWSRDSQWLAFFRENLTLVRPDGAGLVTFPDLPPVKWFKWSPTEQLLAVGTHGSGVWTLNPSGSIKSLVYDNYSCQTLAWAPEGKQVACTTSDIGANPLPVDIIWTAPAEGGRQTKVLQDEQNGLYLVDWWPDGKGLFYRVAYAHAVSASMDGLPLMSLPLDGGAPRKLTTMLANDRWISWAPDRQQFLATVGGGRTPWSGKSLAICDTEACRPLPQPDGVVSLDGVWSPDGAQIAFVRAEARAYMASGEGWIETRTLWVAKPDGSDPRQLKNAGTGVVSPSWISPTQLIYAAAESLWLIEVDDSPPQAVARLSPSDSTYYGRLNIRYAWTR